MRKKTFSEKFAANRSIALGGCLSASIFILLMAATSPQQSDSSPITLDPVAQRILREVKQLQKKGSWKPAAARLKEYATARNPELLLAYAKILARGWGVPTAPEVAREKLLIAVQREFSKRGEAAYELAKIYRKSSDPNCFRIAFEWFHKAAKWGMVKAHAELGRHYARGIGTSVNMRLALKHYRIAAASGSATTLVRFANTIKKQQGRTGQFELDPKAIIVESLPLLKREAHAGKTSAAKALGRVLTTGQFVNRDIPKALFWFRQAAGRGDSGAMFELGRLILSNKPNKLQIGEGLDLIRQAAKHGNAGALTAIGRLHLKGKFNLKPDQSLKYFERGVAAGHPGAMEELARILFEGILVRSNMQRALGLAKRGSALGHRGSKALLSKIMARIEKNKQEGSSPELEKRHSGMPEERQSSKTKEGAV